MSTRQIAPELLVEGVRPSQLAFSPDARHLAFSVTEGCGSRGRGPTTRLWFGSVHDGAPGVTEEVAAGDIACWSADATTIAFASDPDSPGLMSVNLLSVRERTITGIGDITGSVERIAWAHDDQALLVVAADVGSDRAGVATRIEDPSEADGDPRTMQPARARRRLYRVGVPAGNTVEIGPEHRSVWDFDVHDDRVVAVVSSDPSESGWYRAHLALMDLGQRTVRQLYAPSWQIAGPRLSPDGTRVAFIEGICSDRGSEIGDVRVVDIESGAVIAPTSDVDVTGVAWADDEHLWYFGRRGMASSCGSLSMDGPAEEIWCGEVALRGGCVSPDGHRLAAVIESPTKPPEVCLLQLQAPHRGWQPLTSLNAPLGDLDPPPVERLTWSAPDGLPIEGLVTLPQGHSRPAPMVVMVHGGPIGSWSYAFPSGTRHAALLATAGYAVLLPNPRGSSGRGQDFAQSVVGDLGGAELADTLAGVDACVAAGIADPDRIGIMGASHGGFIAAWAATQSARFRASIAIACVSDYLSCHYTSNIGGLDDMLFTGLDRIAAYLERSPVVYASQCETPTLIVHGEEDRCCPLGQAEELYGALTEAGVDVELVVYPREGHGLVEREHQLDLWRRIEGWFDRHLSPRSGS